MEEQINSDCFRFNDKEKLKPINDIKPLFVYTIVTRLDLKCMLISFKQNRKYDNFIQME